MSSEHFRIDCFRSRQGNSINKTREPVLRSLQLTDTDSEQLPPSQYSDSYKWFCMKRPQMLPNNHKVKLAARGLEDSHDNFIFQDHMMDDRFHLNAKLDRRF